MIDHVADLGEHSVRLIARSPLLVAKVTELGGKPGPNPDEWCIEDFRKARTIQAVQKMVDFEVPFLAGSVGWPPAAIAQLWREQGLLHGTIRVLAFQGPNQPEIRES